jgi:hypothetical protein
MTTEEKISEILPDLTLNPKTVADMKDFVKRYLTDLEYMPNSV